MPKKLSELTEREAENYLQYLMENEARSILKKWKYQPPQNEPIHRINHDIWSVYLYGDTAKIVYIKSAYNPAYDKGKEQKVAPAPATTERAKDERFSNSVSRSKARIFELASCNEFQYFCTFTQDREKRDRFDLTEFRKDFAQLVRNLNRNRAPENKIKYLLIPEQHRDGAWHMHGLLKGLTADDLTEFKLSDKIPNRIKKTIRAGTKVYDWHRYRRAFGYFTCTEIESREACAKYITKYISKDLQKTVHESGEHLFFASQGLKGKEVVLKNCAERCAFDDWDYENDYCKIKYIKLPPEK